MAQAVQIGRYGAPEVLALAALSLPPLAPRDLRVRTLFAPVNHTDLKIRAGLWPVRKPDPFPYVPGVEVVGAIDGIGSAVEGWTPGQVVITMMQGLGGVRAERPGGYADYVTVAADAVAAVPAHIDPAAIAALGLTGVTAWEGLRRLGPLAGRRILVTGAAGGVGSAATSIARAQGASVIGLVSRPGHADYLRALGAAEVVVVEHGRAPPLDAESIDGVLDSVGGPLFGPIVAALRAGGVLSLVGAVAGGEVGFDAWDLVRPVTLTGYSTESLDGPTLRAAIAALCGLMAAKAIRPPEYRIMPMREAAAAHRLLERGGVKGRVLLQPS